MLCAMVAEGDQLHYFPCLPLSLSHLHGMMAFHSRSSKSHEFQRGEPVLGTRIEVSLTCLKMSILHVHLIWEQYELEGVIHHQKLCLISDEVRKIYLECS